ncbi:hypothetical protein DRP04_02065 [Archaeoglobales archaeon]|nr:MAG: hypothetical protein DRP04_02065 [Archaeoglobales archaeon]
MKLCYKCGEPIAGIAYVEKGKEICRDCFMVSLEERRCLVKLRRIEEYKRKYWQKGEVRMETDEDVQGLPKQGTVC